MTIEPLAVALSWLPVWLTCTPLATAASTALPRRTASLQPVSSTGRPVCVCVCVCVRACVCGGCARNRDTLTAGYLKYGG